MSFPYKIIDLTHTLHETIPCWDGGCGFKHTCEVDYSECETPTKFKIHSVNMASGIGTHMDAPAHCIEGGLPIDQLPLEQLLCPAVVIDISSHVYENFLLQPGDILAFEKTHGIIRPKDFVLIRTGWEKHWERPERYRNNLIFPAVSSEAAELLLQRKIAGLGIDTLSPDRPKSGYPVHQILLSAGKYIVENAASLDLLPPRGSFILTLPIKIKDGTEAPVRLIAFLPQA